MNARIYSAAIMLLAIGMSAASRTTRSVTPAEPAYSISGTWLLTLTAPDRGELLVRMRFDEQRTSDHRTTWSAASRKGALRSMVSWPKYMLARVTGKLPGGGAAIIMQGTATPSGDSTLIRGKMSSQLLGTFYVNGAVTANGVFAQL